MAKKQEMFRNVLVFMFETSRLKRLHPYLNYKVRSAIFESSKKYRMKTYGKFHSSEK